MIDKVNHISTSLVFQLNLYDRLQIDNVMLREYKSPLPDVRNQLL